MNSHIISCAQPLFFLLAQTLVHAGAVAAVGDVIHSITFFSLALGSFTLVMLIATLCVEETLYVGCLTHKVPVSVSTPSADNAVTLHAGLYCTLSVGV